MSIRKHFAVFEKRNATGESRREERKLISERREDEQGVERIKENR